MSDSGARLVRLLVIVLAASFLWACEGDDGKDGATGPQGPQGDQGLPGPAGDPTPTPEQQLAARIDEANVESCIVCHGGVGEEHTAVYDRYVDGSTLALVITGVSSALQVDGTYTVTVNFTITDNGQPLLEAPELPSMEQKRFYMVQYDSSTGQYFNSESLHQITAGSFDNVAAGAGPGEYVLTQPGRTYGPDDVASWTAPNDGAQVYGYIARGPLLEHAGGSGSELPASSHVHLYDDVSNTAVAFGTAAAGAVGAYESAANVSGCEKCHGTPYLKHGYRDPVLTGILPDFGSCKSCHYDDRDGGHEDWQYMVDDPLNWATAGLPTAEVETKYAYKAKLMNDVHMAHAMEFPYPQSMSNCATCHEGKLDVVLAEANFVPETCVSCHPVEGNGAWWEYKLEDGTTEVAAELYAQEHRAPPLAQLWELAGVESFHSITANCQGCHVTGGVAANATFSDLHTGYAKNIYDDTGQRYRDLYTASVNDVSIADDVMTVAFTVSDPAIWPELLVSFYGWDSKQYIIPSHARDGSTGVCGSSGCRLELELDDNVPANPLFPTFTEVAPGSWEVTVDLAAWVDNGAPAGTIPELIANGTIRRAELTVTPQLNLNRIGGPDRPVVLDAVGATFDLGAEQLAAGYFKGSNAVVSTDKCDVCHDSLASSFHEGSGRGGGGTQVCKNCHNPTFSGSHYELASRSIDNYVHAIHSFQQGDLAGSTRGRDLFGPNGDDFDPVLTKRYDQHIKHVFPRFTIRNCEACHLTPEETADGITVVYDVPNQAESMPGLQREVDPVKTWYTMVDPDPASNTNIPETIAVEVPGGRNISGPTTPHVTGPASRACGGCHRAAHIKADDAVALAAFNNKMKANGTWVDTGDLDEDDVLFGIIDKIMSMFE